jgi:hypothetical protein
MISTLQLVDTLFTRVQGGLISSAINGSIYKHSRPADSTKEDVVISMIAADNKQLQEAVLNFNIHAQNLSLGIGGAIDNSQPDHARLKALEGLAITDLSDKWGTDYNFDIDGGSIIQEETSSFINIRVHFYFINLSN